MEKTKIVEKISTALTGIALGVLNSNYVHLDETTNIIIDVNPLRITFRSVNDDDKSFVMSGNFEDFYYVSNAVELIAEFILAYDAEEKGSYTVTIHAKGDGKKSREFVLEK